MIALYMENNTNSRKYYLCVSVGKNSEFFWFSIETKTYNGLWLVWKTKILFTDPIPEIFSYWFGTETCIV